MGVYFPYEVGIVVVMEMNTNRPEEVTEMTNTLQFWSWHKVEAGVYELKTDNGYTVTVARYSDPSANFDNGCYWAATGWNPAGEQLWSSDLYTGYERTLKDIKQEAWRGLHIRMNADAEAGEYRIQKG